MYTFSGVFLLKVYKNDSNWFCAFSISLLWKHQSMCAGYNRKLITHTNAAHQTTASISLWHWHPSGERSIVDVSSLFFSFILIFLFSPIFSDQPCSTVTSSYLWRLLRSFVTYSTFSGPLIMYIFTDHTSIALSLHYHVPTQTADALVISKLLCLYFPLQLIFLLHLRLRFPTNHFSRKCLWKNFIAICKEF